MTAIARIARAHGMTDEVWARHANPWSGWTRLPIIFVLTAALVWRAALGLWLWPALIAIAAWTWLNPRIFPPPATTRNWMSRAVMGERVLIDGQLPETQAARFKLLTWAPALGVPPWLWGVWQADPLWAFAGAVIAFGVKMLFLVACVRLFDRAAADPRYSGWLS